MRFFASSIFVVALVVALGAHGSPQGKKLYSPVRGSTQQEAQTLNCYDYPNYGGDSLQAIDYIPDLAQYGFDNLISGCEFNGVWMLYDNYDYNAANFQEASFYAWGEQYYTDFDANFDNKASSLRYTGAPDGYKYDTINFYEGQYFMGIEDYYYNDAPQFNYDNLGNSVVITGCSAWTVYQYDNYQGSSLCLYPSDLTNCYPGFYPEPADLGFFAGQASSARRGCFSNKKVMPKSIPKGKFATKQEFTYVPDVEGQ